MRLQHLSPDDLAAVAAAVELTNAASKVDASFQHPVTVDGYAGMLRHGWDGEPAETHLAWDGERPAGVVALHTSEWDNRHLAWLEVRVHPDLRGMGRGSELLAFAEDRAEELGRSSVGLDGWDCPETYRFATKHGFPRKGVAVKRRQTLSRVPSGLVDALHAEAATAATSYDLVRLPGAAPEELLPALSQVSESINDAPIDDLDLEDETYPVDRIRAYEHAMAERRKRVYRVIARHRDTGDLAGHTVVAVDGEQPWIGDQHDTTVMAAHRGHRLGLLLKTEMLRWLAVEEPGLGTIDTWNMESNDFMIAVNERLGYEVLGREIQFQRDVR